jgi:hypothetical protein
MVKTTLSTLAIALTLVTTNASAFSQEDLNAKFGYTQTPEWSKSYQMGGMISPIWTTVFAFTDDRGDLQEVFSDLATINTQTADATRMTNYAYLYWTATLTNASHAKALIKDKLYYSKLSGTALSFVDASGLSISHDDAIYIRIMAASYRWFLQSSQKNKDLCYTVNRVNQVNFNKAKDAGIESDLAPIDCDVFRDKMHDIITVMDDANESQNIMQNVRIASRMLQTTQSRQQAYGLLVGYATQILTKQGLLVALDKLKTNQELNAQETLALSFLLSQAMPFLGKDIGKGFANASLDSAFSDQLIAYIKGRIS